MKSLRIIVSWCCCLACMIMIFSFSSENGEASTETSGGVVKEVLSVVMDEEKITPEVIREYQYPIRKLAHFGIYMLLGFCVINALETTVNINKGFLALISLALSFAYASLDEFHQNFSGSRGPSFKDVLIDTSGAVTGILLFLLFLFVFNKLILMKKTDR